jgi:hypothetical protein
MLNKILENERTSDSILYNKACPDFIAMNDGTIRGDYKYCDRSLECRQVGFDFNFKATPMESHYLPIIDIKTGEVVEFQYFCTGMHDLRPLKERIEDNKVS